MKVHPSDLPSKECTAGAQLSDSPQLLTFVSTVAANDWTQGGSILE